MEIKYWLLLTGAVLLGFALKRLYLSSRQYRKTWKPVVCVCKADFVVGIALRSDYDAASREHWSWYRKNPDYRQRMKIWEKPHYGTRGITPDHVAIFQADSDWHHRLTAMCYVEEAVFNVPTGWWYNLSDERRFLNAYRHFFGRKFRGSWEDLSKLPTEPQQAEEPV